MSKIETYRDLIKNIPIDKQAMLAKRDVWKKRFRDTVYYIVKPIFDEDEIIISREDILKEKNFCTKIVKILIWGYPNGGRGKHIQHALNNIDELIKILSNIEGQNLTKDKAEIVIKKLDNMNGLGPSTWSKLLHFFKVSVETHSCQIFDEKIERSLNASKFEDFKKDNWNRMNINDFFDYIERLSKVSKRLNVKPEQLENFFFYYNLGFKL